MCMNGLVIKQPASLPPSHSHHTVPIGIRVYDELLKEGHIGKEHLTPSLIYASRVILDTNV